MTDQPRRAGTLAAPSYVDEFHVPLPGGSGRTAEEWMRTVLEGAPAPVRALLLVGWRTTLGFRAGPPRSPAHILGWPVRTSTPDAIVLEQRSFLVTAQLVLRVTESRLTGATAVRYERPAARAVWAVLGVVHRQMVPRLLGAAVSRVLTSRR